jgi:RNA ligase (TIGR02306 family)
LDAEGADLAPALGIAKYEEPIPVSMQGQARSWPSFLPKYDIENVKRPEFRHVLTEGEAVVLTEKRHGTNIAVAFGPGLGEGERAYVCSRGLALLEAEGNLYWRTAAQHGLVEKLAQVKAQFEAEGVTVETISLHGESLGCQDLLYGASTQAPGFEAFDLRVNGRWVDFPEFVQRCALAGIPTVPVLYEGPYAYDLLDGYAEGTATGHRHLREGVVIRPVRERNDPALGRVQLKYVSGSYLTRGGKATEMR